LPAGVLKIYFFTKRILLFINNLQIFGKAGIFVPVFASQKANRNWISPYGRNDNNVWSGIGEGKSGREASAFPLPVTPSRPLSFRWIRQLAETEKSLL